MRAGTTKARQTGQEAELKAGWVDRSLRGGRGSNRGDNSEAEAAAELSLTY
jgi:hypothetical protein